MESEINERGYEKYLITIVYEIMEKERFVLIEIIIYSVDSSRTMIPPHCCSILVHGDIEETTMAHYMRAWSRSRPRFFEKGSRLRHSSRLPGSRSGPLILRFVARLLSCLPSYLFCFNSWTSISDDQLEQRSFFPIMYPVVEVTYDNGK